MLAQLTVVNIHSDELNHLCNFRVVDSRRPSTSEDPEGLKAQSGLGLAEMVGFQTQRTVILLLEHVIESNNL